MRTALVAALLGIGALLTGSPDRAADASVSALDSVSIPVSDADRAAHFYAEILHFQKLSDREVSGDAYEHLFGVFGLRVRSVRMRLGEESIDLTQYLASPGRPLPADFHANDHWFQHIAIIVSDMDRAYEWLRAHQVTAASSAPQVLPAWNPNAGGIAAYYFRDPDGNYLEILHFPKGLGRSKWHRADSRLFLGIDHTAIVVADTDRSLAFYRDVLGMTVAGESDNYGPEQEHLNNVFGAHLRITALRAAGGPGIELLEYLAPRAGRLYPADSKANDRWSWEINLRVPASLITAAASVDAHLPRVSSYPVTLSDGALGFAKAFVIRDPDGHAINLELGAGP
jgi:catechol 2,3-dioxygenase-like lactoylglutathione lyase family enzyme